MTALGTIELGTYTSGSPSSNTAITGSDPVLENIAGTDDADFVIDNSNTTHTGVAAFALGNVPSDFASMITVAINLRYGLSTTKGNNDWDSLTAQIVESDGSTALTDAVEIVAGIISNTTPANSGAIALTNPNAAASEATWNAALVLLRFVITRNKGGDSVDERVYAAEVTGTYIPDSVTLTALSDAEYPDQNYFVGPFSI